MASTGLDIWVSSTCFQKSNINWPQQPLPEKVLKFNMTFHDSTKKKFLQNIKIKLNSRIWMTLKSSVVIIQSLSAASITSTASTTSLTSMTSTASFHEKFYWSWWLDHHPWQPNDQYRPLFVEWIINIPFLHWYMISFLLKAVEASVAYVTFFKTNWRTSNVQTSWSPRHPVKKYWSFYPSELFSFDHFTLIHPVIWRWHRQWHRQWLLFDLLVQK